MFLGGQPADDVKVLPDMSGLSAHFNSVSMPPSKPKEVPFADIVVVTSEGIATLPTAVQIFADGTIAGDK